MSRALVTIHSTADRERIGNWASKAPTGTRVEFKAAQRTLPQNDRMWAMLTDVSTQKEHCGRKYTPDQWKVIFMHACGQEVQFIPSLDNKTFIPWGQRSSDLGKDEMSQLIDFIGAWGAENQVHFNDPADPSAPSDAGAATGPASAAPLNSSEALQPPAASETKPAPEGAEAPSSAGAGTPQSPAAQIPPGEERQATEPGDSALHDSVGLPEDWPRQYAAALMRAQKIGSLSKYAAEFWKDYGTYAAIKATPHYDTAESIYAAFRDHFGPAGEEARNVILHELKAI